MADFHFLRPWWLLALLPLALFYWRLLVVQKTQSGWHQWLPQHLSQVLVNSAGSKTSWSAHRLGLFWLVSSVALAGPTWERLPQPVYQLETGQVVIMDMSPSMLATDIEPDRLTQQQFKAMDLVKSGLDGDTGLVAYAGDAFTISPLTADNNNLLNLIPSLSPGIMPVAGSEPLRALKLADELLSNAGYAEGDIYWLTDGIDSSELNSLSNYLRKQPHRVSVLGIGTTEGAPIRNADGQLVKDRFNQAVIAKLTPSRLQDLAELTGGVYQTVRRDNQDIKAFIAQPPLTREGKDSEQQQQGDQWRDNGPFLALLLVPLMLFSWRRGGSLGVWLLLTWLPLSLYSPTSFAQQQTSNDASSWWLNVEQQAQQLYQQKQYQTAAELSQQPLRRGAAEYRAGDYQAAADSFAQSDSPEGWYNRGNALAQLEQFDAATDAYQTALDKRPDWQAAQQNLELMQQLLEQQEQQQGEQQEQNQEQQDDGEQGEDRRDQSGQSQGNNQGQQDSQSGNSEEQQQDESQDQQQDNEQQQQDQKQQQEGKQQQPEAGQQQPESDQRRNRRVQFNDDIDPEKAQQLEQWMKRIPDDPSILLRNKMLLESQRRNQRRASKPQGEKKKW
ncbi:VWA domain-containing protein [Idiomarina seosinensis]|uniref:VWFA domain-containing protein n=1 Tax=Idiomarina seosinensis TaxID=281739 RepID=A0A432ZGT4_9GAMM|nr:VWA domain-containing protein [Idiomarina seosinensis]RUO77178.1 hypothetical protein CWI81_01390 [Idiomarina seosinensis]